MADDAQYTNSSCEHAVWLWNFKIICLSYVFMHAGREWKVYKVAKTVFENNDTETRKSLQSDNGGKKSIIFLAFTLHFIHQAFLYMFALLS